MRIVWTARYNKSLEYIFTCARDVYSRTTLKKLNSSIKSIEAILIENPLLGAVEPLLIGKRTRISSYCDKTFIQDYL